MNRTPTPDTPSLFDYAADFWHNLDGFLQAIVLFGLALGTVVAFYKWLRPRVSNARSDIRAVRDTLVGRPAQFDTITKRQTQPALPSIGERMAAQEEAVRKVAEVVDKIADTTTRLDQHEKRLERIEDALQIDRRLDKIEGIQLLRTIETAVQAERGEDPTIGGNQRPD